MNAPGRPLHVSLLAIPDAAVSTLTGIYDVLNAFRMMPASDTVPASPPFKVDIVGLKRGPVKLASGIPIEAHRGLDEITETDIVIAPSVLLSQPEWEKNRYPEMVAWISGMHRQGASLCSACSGLFLLAETGLFDGVEATVHWGYADAFRRSFPNVPIFPERVLVAAGERQQFVCSGAAMAWHDLVLYLISRHVGATAAQTVARFFALQWHHDGLAPYIVFEGPKNHGDAAIAATQEWLAAHFSVASPVDEMIRQSGLPERTFKRRFTNATGYTPIDYIQRLRIEDAKRRLERTDASVEDIGWRVGYEDSAYFRRLFKRTTGLAPGAYRRKFQIPQFASDRT